MQYQHRHLDISPNTNSSTNTNPNYIEVSGGSYTQLRWTYTLLNAGRTPIQCHLSFADGTPFWYVSDRAIPDRAVANYVS